MSAIDVSLIIPVFNGQETIVRCLDSIYNLSLSNDRFEVIVIDDCSTDNTFRIVSNYAVGLNNFTLIRQEENHRTGAARNRGIIQAKGTYVMFVDADDTVESGLPDALSVAKTTAVDMLWCQWRRQNKPNGAFELVTSKLCCDTILSGPLFCEKYYDMMVYGSSWTYLIRRDFILETGIPFVEDRMLEDVDWIEKHLFYCDRITCSESTIYSYYYNEGSIIHSFSAQRYADTLMYCIRRLQFAEKIESLANCFSERVKQYCFGTVNVVFSFRHVSNHSSKSIIKIYKDIGKESLAYLSKFKWSHPFTHICITHPHFIVCLMALIHPFSELARRVYHYCKL